MKKQTANDTRSLLRISTQAVQTQNSVVYREDIARWNEDMKFIFEWKKDFTCSLRSLVKSFFHEKINFISSNQRVIFYILHRYECFEIKKNYLLVIFQYSYPPLPPTRRKTKENLRNDISDIFTSEDMENISLVSRMQFRMESTSCLFFGKTLISM